MPTTTEVQRPARSSSKFSILLRLGTTAAALAVWFWTQSLIASRPLPTSGIADWTHGVTATANSYLLTHTTKTNILLILSSALIDLMGIFLLGRWLVLGQTRPFLGLVMVLCLRQLMQACVALPAPPHEIWHNPGFPSLLVTYGVSNDFFFSGHTAIATLAAAELVTFGKRWLSALAVALVIFEMTIVLVLRAHYVMDVFTGLITGLYASHLADRISVPPALITLPHDST